MTPEEKKARDALESILVANYASAEVWLEVAVPIIAQAIAQAAAEEREAIAKFVEEWEYPSYKDGWQDMEEAVPIIAAAIRARGQA